MSGARLVYTLLGTWYAFLAVLVIFGVWESPSMHRVAVTAFSALAMGCFLESDNHK